MLLPIHWGTFDLAPHAWHAPAEAGPGREANGAGWPWRSRGPGSSWSRR
ncbi:hypothetical protein ACU686_23055 [Yinghuangia aomiensis]